MNLLFGHWFARPDYWDGATAFNYADKIPPTYWRKRKNIPQVVPDTSEQTLTAFATAIGQYFYQHQGRGLNCHVEHYQRLDIDYFFAYPEDHPRTIIGWKNNEFDNQTYHPAFDLIFAYDQDEQTLNIYVKQARQIILQLQDLFAQHILKTALPIDNEDERIYDLKPLLTRDFQFKYPADIQSVTVKKLRLAFSGEDRRKLTLEANSKKNDKAIYDFLDHIKPLIERLPCKVSQAVLAIQLPHLRHPNKTRNLNITLTWPNHCTAITDKKTDKIIHQMLIDSHIETTTTEELIHETAATDTVLSE